MPPDEKEYSRAFLQRVPAYTYAKVEGQRILLPKESCQRYQNVECPQFYPLFPFNRFALGRDDMELFRDTWKHGTFPKNMVISWHPEGSFNTRMGMVKEALLLPAWPKEWEVDFKLHAPGNTVAECVYRSGKSDKFKVTPESRAPDLVLPQ